MEWGLGDGTVCEAPCCFPGTPLTGRVLCWGSMAVTATVLAECQALLILALLLRAPSRDEETEAQRA